MVGIIPKKINGQNHAQETPHVLLSSLINRGEFHAIRKKREGNKKDPCIKKNKRRKIEAKAPLHRPFLK
jgi:hypothetical protein